MIRSGPRDEESKSKLGVENQRKANLSLFSCSYCQSSGWLVDEESNASTVSWRFGIAMFNPLVPDIRGSPPFVDP